MLVCISPSCTSLLKYRGLQPTDFAGDTFYARMLEWFLSTMDWKGVVVVIGAGNRGYNKLTGRPYWYQADRCPSKFVTNASPYILVGATYHDGSIAEFTTPPGAWPLTVQNDDPDTLSISIWAQGVGVYTCNPKSMSTSMGLRSGTSFATPQVVSTSTRPSLSSLPWCKSTSAIRLLMVLVYPGRPCCLHALVSVARWPEPLQPWRQPFRWPTYEDIAC